MSIEVELPDFSTLTQGFDKIGNLKDTYKQLNALDTKSGYIKTTEGSTTGAKSRTDKLSKQQLNNISQKIGNNPFEAVQKIFEDVPLINIETKDLNIKVPAITSEEIQRYKSYMTLWIDQNEAILKDREQLIQSITKICNVPEIENADTNQINQDIEQLDNNNMDAQEQTKLNEKKQLLKKIEACAKMQVSIKNFINFQANTEGIINSVKANINVLEQYKAFPSQLYERTHVTDRYLTETSLMLS